MSHFPGLFRLKVYPEEAGGSGGNGGGGIVGGVGTENGMEEVEDHEKMPDGDPLLDYEVGVFEENKFELRIVIPAPNEEPDYEKSFRLIIVDAKNRLDIRVRRAVQPPAEMQQRRMYTVSSNSKSFGLFILYIDYLNQTGIHFSSVRCPILLGGAGAEFGSAAT